MVNYFKVGAGVSYVLCIIMISFGVHKMFVYENPESTFRESKNAYVGGDAYNYIINANYASAYFVLACFFAIIGATLVISAILIYVNQNKEARLVSNVKEDTSINES